MFEYPKVLVIDATPFNRTHNNGIVKSNLFKDWPQDRLAQIVYSNNKPGFDVCNHYWLLNKWDIVKGFFRIETFAEISSDGMRKSILDITDGPNSGYDSRPSIEIKLSILPLKLRILLGEVIYRLPSVLSNTLRQWVEDFQPDVIFTMAGTAPILRTAVQVSKWRDVPIIIYFTDDWVSTLYRDHPLGHWLRRSLLFWMEEGLRRSPVRMTICDSMTEEYTRRYGGEFKTFMNLVECGEEKPYKKKDISKYDTVRLIFIGGMSPGRWKSLRAIGEALYDLRSENIRGELLVYTFPKDIINHRSNLTLEPVMRVMGTATSEEVASLQRDADVLVHVESFDPAMRQYTRFSLSTKIPQYMSAGSCIFAYGPGEVASMRYLRDSGGAITVCEDNRELLRTSLRQLINNREQREVTARHARLITLEHNDGRLKRKQFKEVVVQSCNASKKF